uniref:Sodium channel, voltage-gated, type II, beta n=1 Tax=Cynoglossus semilaevis TaxID=244447 RepID=A0A3P8UQQ2_CYNSE
MMTWLASVWTVRPWLTAVLRLTPALRLTAELRLTVALLFFLPGCSCMDVLVTNNINALNGSTIKISCTFTSCYKMDAAQFSMNWTYQESSNHTEERFMTYHVKKKMVPVRSDRFGDRVMFAGNLDKNDLSITLSDVQLEDVGIYNCYVKNPPDRIQGHGIIQLNVVTEPLCKTTAFQPPPHCSLTRPPPPCIT